MAVLERYYFEQNMLQTQEMIAVKIVKVKSLGKMIHFANLVKDIKSFAELSPCRQFQVRRNDVK